MAPFLSPIQSSGDDETLTLAGATASGQHKYRGEQSAEVDQLQQQQQQHQQLLRGKKQRRQSGASTGSQTSELERDQFADFDEEDEELEAEEEEDSAAEKLNLGSSSLTMKRQTEQANHINNNNNNNSSKQYSNQLQQPQQQQQQQQRRSKSATASYVGANSSAGSSKSGSLAEQYLLTAASNPDGAANGIGLRLPLWTGTGGGSGSGAGKRRFKQMLQSIPLPLLATSLVTVLVFCVLLSENRTFQLAEAQDPTQLRQRVDALPLVMSQQRQQQPLGQPEEPSDFEQQQQQQQQQQPEEMPTSFTGTFEQQQQTSNSPDAARAIGQRVGKLRRGIIAEFLQRQQLASLQQQHQQHSKHPRHPLATSIERREQRDSGELRPTESEAGSLEGDQPGAFDALLMGGGGGGGIGEQQAIETAAPAQNGFVDGGPEPVRPAHLRTSPLELDPVEQQQQTAAAAASFKQHRNQHQQPQLVAYKTNEDHHQHHQQHRHNHMSNQYNPNNNNFNSNPDRAFDVPQIQCNNTDEGFERFACPSPDDRGFRCIEDRLFCDGYRDCPNGEDEDRVSCMYYRLFVSHIDILTNTFITFMKKQNRINNARVTRFVSAG